MGVPLAQIERQRRGRNRPRAPCALAAAALGAWWLTLSWEGSGFAVCGSSSCHGVGGPQDRAACRRHCSTVAGGLIVDVEDSDAVAEASITDFDEAGSQLEGSNVEVVPARIVHGVDAGPRREGGGYEEEEEDAAPEEAEDAVIVVGAPNKRLDEFLAEHYGMSRSFFGKLISEGAARVNGIPRKKAFKKLFDGDVIVVRFRVDEPVALEPQAIPLDILYEDDDIVVINKEAGMVVHPAPDNWKGTLINGLLHHLGARSSADALPLPLGSGSLGEGAEYRPGVVHRLDVNTSGVMVVAKTEAALHNIRSAFANRTVNKTYLAVSQGTRYAYRGHDPGFGYKIDHPLGRSRKHPTRMAVVNDGKPSLTLVRSVAESQYNALLEVQPKTGRTHQIRVHLAKEHTPVLGDNAYGYVKPNRRKSKMAPRPLLHAYRLAFTHPRNGQRLEFVAPPPQDLVNAVRLMTPQETEVEFFNQIMGGISS